MGMLKSMGKAARPVFPVQMDNNLAADHLVKALRLTRKVTWQRELKDIKGEGALLVAG